MDGKIRTIVFKMDEETYQKFKIVKANLRSNTWNDLVKTLIEIHIIIE